MATRAGPSGESVDPSYTYDALTVSWPTETAGFQLEELAYGVTEAGWFYSSLGCSAVEHGGTPLDAPIHFAAGRRTADEVPVDDPIGPTAAGDVTAQVNPDYLVTVADLEAWEAARGTLPEGAIVLLRTGWGEGWGDRTAYLGTDLVGPEAVPELHFPGLHPVALPTKIGGGSGGPLRIVGFVPTEG